MGRFLIHVDAQDAQDFFRRRLACVPGHPQIRTRSLPESASPAAASRPDDPVHRCSIDSPSRWICPVAGGGRPARRQTGVSQRGQAGFQRSRPPDTPHLTIGTTPPGASSHDRVTPTGQKCRSILAPVVVEGGPSVLVPIRVHWWFVFKNDRQFLPRVIHPPKPNPPKAPRPVPGRCVSPSPACPAGSRACAGCA